MNKIAMAVGILLLSGCSPSQSLVDGCILDALKMYPEASSFTSRQIAVATRLCVSKDGYELHPIDIPMCSYPLTPELSSQCYSPENPITKFVWTKIHSRKESKEEQASK